MFAELYPKEPTIQSQERFCRTKVALGFNKQDHSLVGGFSDYSRAGITLFTYSTVVLSIDKTSFHISAESKWESQTTSHHQLLGLLQALQPAKTACNLSSGAQKGAPKKKQVLYLRDQKP